MSDAQINERSASEGARQELAAILADLYARFWAIAALYRKGRIAADSEASDAALVEQRVICILYQNYKQGLHRFDGDAG